MRGLGHLRVRLPLRGPHNPLRGLELRNQHSVAEAGGPAKLRGC